MVLSWTLQPSDKFFSFKFCQLTRVKQTFLPDEKAVSLLQAPC